MARPADKSPDMPIDPTPAMIAAGVEELERQYLDITGGATEEDFQEAVAAIYREMEKAKEEARSSPLLTCPRI